MSETLFIALLLAAVWVLVARPWNVGLSWVRLIAGGALLGASALVRPLTIVWIPVLLILLYSARRSWRHALVATGVFALAAGLVLLPWVVRNTATFGEPVFVSTNGGDDLCIGHNAAASGTYFLAPVCAATEEERLDEPTHDRRNQRRAIRYAVSHPAHEVSLLFRKAYYTLEHDHDGLEHTYRYLADATDRRNTYRKVFALVADAWFWVMAGLALLAAFERGPYDPRKRFVFLAGCTLALAPLVFFGDPRFKVPVEPFLAIAAAVTVERALARRRSGRVGAAGAASGGEEDGGRGRDLVGEEEVRRVDA
jgi:hypothetical protein